MKKEYSLSIATPVEWCAQCQQKHHLMSSTAPWMPWQTCQWLQSWAVATASDLSSTSHGRTRRSHQLPPTTQTTLMNLHQQQQQQHLYTLSQHSASAPGRISANHVSCFHRVVWQRKGYSVGHETQQAASSSLGRSTFSKQLWASRSYTC